MKHIIRMIHRLTEDQTGVFFSCEENGQVYFVSDLKKNGMFHLNGKDGAPLQTYGVHLFATDTQARLISFMPNQNAYEGTFYDANNVPVGNIAPVGTGCNRYYVATLFGHRFECYTWAVGTAPCMMFYENGIQKAMLVEDKLSVNQMYSMTIHIADDENVAMLCMLGLIYHQFENVRNMNSRFRREFIRNGWNVSFCENVANYHFEVPIKGVGKEKYNLDFLRQFYPYENFPYQDGDVTVGSVMKEMGHGFRETAGEVWTEENLKQSLKNPVAIIVLVGCPLIMAIIGGFVGPLMLDSLGFDISSYGNGVKFIIGFLLFGLVAGAGEGIFFLFYKWLASLFDKKA